MTYLILIPLAVLIASVNIAERRRRAAMTARERQEEDNELKLW